MAYERKSVGAAASPEPTGMPEWTETPEFKRAVAAAALRAVEAVMANLPKPGPNDIASNVFDRLAKSIDDLTNQDSRRIHIAPEVLARCNAERARMGKLILARREAIRKAEHDGLDAEDEWPLYRVLDRVYLNERMISPYERGPRGEVNPTVIQWDGVPNAYMLPMNAHAQTIHDAWAGSITTTENGPNIGPQPLWMSHNGLVVRGDPPSASKSRIGFNNGTGAENGALDVARHQARLGVRGAIDPGAEFVHVLGTLAAPARQNYRGSDGPRPTHKLSGTA